MLIAFVPEDRGSRASSSSFCAGTSLSRVFWSQSIFLYCSSQELLITTTIYHLPKSNIRLDQHASRLSLNLLSPHPHNRHPRTTTSAQTKRDPLPRRHIPSAIGFSSIRSTITATKEATFKSTTTKSSTPYIHQHNHQPRPCPLLRHPTRHKAP
jgi:hypothetical protein